MQFAAGETSLQVTSHFEHGIKLVHAPIFGADKIFSKQCGLHIISPYFFELF
jgi:hypothetical protein